MASKGSVVWRGDVQMGQNCLVYGHKVLEAVTAVATYFAPVLETAAKKFGPWTDRSGNLRQTLHAWVEEFSKDVIYLYLSHGMWYSVFIETKYAGRYRTIWPVLQAHLPQITAMLKSIFS